MLLQVRRFYHDTSESQTHLLLGGQIFFDVGLDSPEHKRSQDGVQLLDYVIPSALVRLKATQMKITRTNKKRKNEAQKANGQDTKRPLGWRRSITDIHPRDSS